MKKMVNKIYKKLEINTKSQIKNWRIKFRNTAHVNTKPRTTTNTEFQ